MSITRWWPVLIVVGGALTLRPGLAQVRAGDAERLLVERFGFTPADLAQARDGKAVARLLPSPDQTEVGLLAAVRIAGTPDRLLAWLKDVASFRKAAELGLARRISHPPQMGDFADLALDADEMSALRTCRPGNCELRIGERTMQQFQAIDWTAADAGRRANLLARQLMLGLADAYLKGGDQALGAYHNEKTPRSAADEFRLVLSHATALHDIAPSLASFLERFPAATLPQSEQLLYWAKGGVGPEASITLHQLIVWHAPGGAVFVVDKQLFASRYVDAAVTVISLAPAADGAGFYVLAGARARSTMLGGIAARLLRSRVEQTARETAVMYLDWIRASLS